MDSNHKKMCENCGLPDINSHGYEKCIAALRAQHDAMENKLLLARSALTRLHAAALLAEDGGDFIQEVLETVPRILSNITEGQPPRVWAIGDDEGSAKIGKE